MKTYSGSLQRKGRQYYLVVRVADRQRWLALKTDKLWLARQRAAKLAPADADDETAWLRQLAQAGDWARRKLAEAQARRELTWENIAGVCALNGAWTYSAESRRSHERWFGILAEQVAQSAGDVQPGALTAELARAACRTMAERYVSTARMLRFFRRAWTMLGLDASVWPRQPAASTVASEHYRRLTLEEVRRVHAHLCGVSPELADMVLIGYSTGLRLSDVVELELSEVDGAFLRVCPNKTRRRKPRPLRIPLTAECQAVVARRAAVAEAHHRQALFERRCDISRHVSRAFRQCGVAAVGNGRASFHSLRATFISLMDEAGIPPHVTDAITGHGGGGMHARYTQPSDAALRDAVRRACLPLRPPR